MSPNPVLPCPPWASSLCMTGYATCQHPQSHESVSRRLSPRAEKVYHLEMVLDCLALGFAPYPSVPQPFGSATTSRFYCWSVM